MNILRRWFPERTEQHTDDNLMNPWAGVASYEDPETSKQKLKFCGRDDEIYDVTKLVMGNIIVTLYGKSGIGKTSLLNAGVFPELREELGPRDERYIPISIRLGIRDEKQPQSYQKMIVEKIENTKAVAHKETIPVIAEQTDQQAIDYLWNYFARHRFYDKNDELACIVVVFDQFEEVFRGHREEAEILLRQLDYLNDKDHTIDRCTVEGKEYLYEFNFRFILSIREDDLYRLEDSIDNCYLPALKRCRYRLRSLSKEGARDVILTPGAGLFMKEEEDSIVESIIGKSRNKNGSGSINTNIISLLCSRIFIDFQHRKETDHISQKVVDDFIKGRPIEQFYNEATRELTWYRKRRLERNLITENGHRKYIDEKTFEDCLPDPRIRRHLLEGNLKILQRVPISSQGEAYGVELIHDSFCEAISNIRRKRQTKRMHYFYALIILLALFFSVMTAIIAKKEADKAKQREIEAWLHDNIHTLDFKCRADSIAIENYKWDAYVSIYDLSKDSLLVIKGINGFTNPFHIDDSTPENWTVGVHDSIVRQHPDIRIMVEVKDSLNFYLSSTDTVHLDPEEMVHTISLSIMRNPQKTFPCHVIVEQSPMPSSIKKGENKVNNAFVAIGNHAGRTDENGIATLFLTPEEKFADRNSIVVYKNGYKESRYDWMVLSEGGRKDTVKISLTALAGNDLSSSVDSLYELLELGSSTDPVEELERGTKKMQYMNDLSFTSIEGLCHHQITIGSGNKPKAIMKFFSQRIENEDNNRPICGWYIKDGVKYIFNGCMTKEKPGLWIMHITCRTTKTILTKDFTLKVQFLNETKAKIIEEIRG